ncbi:unnamed protein product [Amoebophrya sp. A120]|nr:unnamed protein product [Amoebophrya sp. A120]|eukprot:GSA120T00004509001.1
MWSSWSSASSQFFHRSVGQTSAAACSSIRWNKNAVPTSTTTSPHQDDFSCHDKAAATWCTESESHRPRACAAHHVRKQPSSSGFRKQDERKAAPSTRSGAVQLLAPSSSCSHKKTSTGTGRSGRLLTGAAKISGRRPTPNTSTSSARTFGPGVARPFFWATRGVTSSTGSSCANKASASSWHRSRERFIFDIKKPVVYCLEHDNWDKSRLPPPQVYRGVEFYPTPTRFLPRLGLQQGSGKKLFKQFRVKPGTIASRRALVESFLTPNELFFVHYKGKLPEEPDISWRLEVETAVGVASSTSSSFDVTPKVIAVPAFPSSYQTMSSFTPPSAMPTSSTQYDLHEDRTSRAAGASSSHSQTSNMKHQQNLRLTQQKTVLSLTLDDLRTKFPQHDVVCVIDCSGNSAVGAGGGTGGAAGATASSTTPSTTNSPEMIGCARWTGPKLRDVLTYCKILPEMAAVSASSSAGRASTTGSGGGPNQPGGPHRVRVLHFYSDEKLLPGGGAASTSTTSASSGQEASSHQQQARISIPLDRALSPAGSSAGTAFDDAILALEMNGFELPFEQGFPVRLIVPGYTEQKQLKWVSRILLETAVGEEASAMGYTMMKRITILDEATRDAGENALTALICVPEEQDTCYVQEGAEEAATVEVRGIAYSGGGHGIRRVQISSDNGKKWIAAEIYGTKYPHAWVQWKQKLVLPMEEKKKLAINKKLDVEILVRVTNGVNKTQELRDCDRVTVCLQTVNDLASVGAGFDRTKSKRMNSRKPSKVEKESFKKAETVIKSEVQVKAAEESGVFRDEED